MAHTQKQLHKAAQLTVLDNAKEERERSLKERDNQIQQLGTANDQLTEQVQHLKSLIKDAHVRYEDDLELTVASLQDQYNSALEVLQLATDLDSHTARERHTQSAPFYPGAEQQLGSGGRGASSLAGGGRTGDPSQKRQQPHQTHGPSNPGKSTRPDGAAVGAVGRGSQWKAAETDPRLTILGLDPFDFSPATAYGASVGLVTEPVAVLRDVLNLDGAHDREREQLRERMLPFSAGFAVGVSGPFLAQAQFETRLRGAYRSMLLQLQHRYQVERERQEEVHKLQLQDQEERHSEAMRQLAARQQEELEEAARRRDHDLAAMRADVQKLWVQLAAAKAAAETSQSQAAAARAATDALQAQLQLLRTTHEAELQHVRQGSVPLGQHEEVVHQLRVEWEVALQQRERDFSALLTEVAGLRRQLSVATEPSRSSGHSCGNGASLVSPAAPASASEDARPVEPPHTAARVALPASAPSGAATGASQDSLRHPRPVHSLPQPHRPSMCAAPERAGEHPPHAMPEEGGGATRLEGRQAGDARQVLVDAGGVAASRPAGAVPGSPAPSGFSVALSLDEHGSAVLEISEDTAATPHSRAYQLPVTQDGDGSRPPSAASSRLSDLVNAIVYGNTQRGSAAAVDHGGDNDSDPAVGPVSRIDCGRPGDRQPHRSSLPTNLRPGGDASAKEPWVKAFTGAYGSFTGWQAETGSRPPGGAGGDGGVRPDSPEQYSSEITLDIWQAQGPGHPTGSGYSDAVAGGQRSGRDDVTGSDRPGGVAASRPRSSPPPPPPPAHRLADDSGHPRSGEVPRGAAAPAVAAATGGVQSVARRARAASSAPPVAVGASGGSVQAPLLPVWGLHGRSNASSTSDALRCMRCGLNDEISPGCCRFHPALLAEPGSLRYSPEWMTCHAADHTARTPGCFVRSEHFYEPGSLQPRGQAEAAAPRPSTGKSPAGVHGGPPRELSPRSSSGGAAPERTTAAAAATVTRAANLAGRGPAGNMGSAWSWGEGSGAVEASGSRARASAMLPGRKVAWGRVESSPPRAGLEAQAGPVGAAGAGSRADAARTYIATRVRSPGRGALASGPAASLVGESSPSPKPRTRLPSPLRR